MIDYIVQLNEIRKQYLSDKRPWVVCYSGGKDSTALLQMTFAALSELPKVKLNKEVHVLTNDTLVENPVIAEYVSRQLENIETAGKKKLYAHRPELFKVARVTPSLEDSFWVNLIGKGYPSPNRWFRWCTERLKINPTSTYIKETVGKSGSAIIVLGTRRAESSNRAASMDSRRGQGRLRKHELTNAFVYAPIADLSNDEVWAYLLQARNPWGANNKELLGLYRKACQDGECPYVIETGTQSCGKSRFGCWVCTVVDKDRAMESYVNNGNKWMVDLLNYRNWLYDIRQQSYQHVPKRLESRVKFGAFLLSTRRELLNRLLSMQAKLNIGLITPAELEQTKIYIERDATSENGRLRKFKYILPDHKHITVFSDYDIVKTPRQRLGPLSLKRAEYADAANLSADYARLTRVMYYVEENGKH
jgi:DNA sulfur modification protein DndC